MEGILIETKGWPNNRVYRSGISSQCKVKIGRAADNDVIVSDMTVAPYQVEIEVGEEGVHLRVLDHTNPVKVNNKVVANSVELKENCELLIGSTQLRLWLDQPLIPAAVELRPRGIWKFLSHPVVSVALVLLTLGYSLFIDYLSTIEEYKFNGRFLTQQLMILGVLYWLIESRMYFLTKRHLLWACLSAIALISFYSDLVSELILWLDFQFPMLNFSTLLYLFSFFVIMFIWRSLLKHFMRLKGKELFSYSMLFSALFFILFLYNYLEEKNYFMKNDGMSPSYAHGLSQHRIEGIAEKSIEDFFAQ